MSSSNSPKSVLINSLISRDIKEAHRSATALELFYDLIYVVAIASLASELHHALSDWHHVGHAILMYVFIFFCIWWPWNTYTWFASGYDTDDAQFRLASLAQMIGVIIIAVGVKPAFVDDNFVIIMIGYVIMRIPYILMWLKVAHDDLNSRPVAIRYALGVFIAQVAWTISILYFQSWYIFIALLVFELLVPYLAEHSVDKGKNNKYHPEHIEERLGLLTIIVLGESMLAVVYAFENVVEHFTMDIFILASSAVLILFSMWWLYFDDTLEEELESETKSFIWAYGHYFIYGFATAVGVLISVNVDAVIDHAEIESSTAAITLALMIVGYLVSVWLCHDFLLKKKGLRLYELLIFSVLIMGLTLLFHSVLLISIAFVALIVIRLTREHLELKKQNLA